MTAVLKKLHDYRCTNLKDYFEHKGWNLERDDDKELVFSYQKEEGLIALRRYDKTTGIQKVS